MTMPPMVMVVWDDHHISLDEISREDAANLKPMRRYSSGFLWAEGEFHIALVMDWSPEKPDHADPCLYIDRRTIAGIYPAHVGPVLGDED